MNRTRYVVKSYELPSFIGDANYHKRSTLHELVVSSGFDMNICSIVKAAWGYLKSNNDSYKT